MPNVAYTLLIVLLPLASFVLLGLFGRRYLSGVSGLLATGLLTVSALLAFYTAYGYYFVYGQVNGVFQPITVFKYNWLHFSEGMSIDMGAVIDPISAMMLVVVALVSLMVHIYSIAYLKGEERFPTYYAFLGLFTFSMLGLVLSTNIFQLYFFWELVGVSSFLLIGYYYDRPSAVAACKKAFIVTRFADLGFLLGILVLSHYAHSFDFATIIRRLTTYGTFETDTAVAASFMGVSALTWGVVLVFMGGAGKSAMFPLHIWLPDAMEGPTPVSALIHAATMVVAGVFLVARLFPVFSMSPPALQLVTWIGVASALFAAVIACTQTDIKRVLAYSTMSQIGFMMFSLGVSGTVSDSALGFTASLFHLFTHALFKALLFLGAGAVIHYVHSNELADMGGLRKKMPITHLTFLIACLAISGIWPFAGFFSKEEILLAAYLHTPVVFCIALATSALTAFYMFRLYFSIFWKRDAVHTVHHHGEGGLLMMLPLVVLAMGAMGAGFIPFGQYVSADGTPLHTSMHWQFSIVPLLLAAGGILLAARLYKTDNNRANQITNALKGLYKAAYHRFYIDEVYRFVTHRILFNLVGKPAAWVDRNVVDGMVNATGDGTGLLAEKIKRLQSGRVQLYAFWFLGGVMLLGVIFIYLWK